MSLLQSPETLMVDTKNLYCDGGGDAMGHPRVFLTMSSQNVVDCPYCGRHFVLNANKAKPGGH